MEILTFNEGDFNNKAANFLEAQIRSLLKKKSVLNIAISGGRSPLPIYKELASRKIEWGKLNIFLVDERCVEVGSIDSNYEVIRQSFFDFMQAKNFAILQKDMSFLQMAEEYQQIIEDVVPSINGIPSFDLVLLGMGLDGHTASLFPDTEALKNETDLVIFNEVPNMTFNRITFSYPLLLNSKKIILIIEGREKLNVLKSAFQKALPITKLVPGIQYILN